MEKPKSAAQQAAAQFKAHIDQEFKPELTAILKEVRPFSLLEKLREYYHQNQSMFPSIKEMCASFMIAIKYPTAALGYKISDLGPASEVEQAWQKEWAIAHLSRNLNDSEQVIKILKQELQLAENECKSSVEQQEFNQEFNDVECDLREQTILLAHAKQILNKQDQLQSLKEKPLEMFRNKEFRTHYHETLRLEYYSLQSIDKDAQELHPKGLPLLFQLCHEGLAELEFKHMLHFLTSGQQPLLINQMINGETVLDYATRYKLDHYIKIIEKRGCKRNKPIIRSVLKSSDSHGAKKTVRKSVSFSHDPVDPDALQEKNLA